MWSNLFANLTVVGSIHAIPPTATGVAQGSNVFVFSNVSGQSMIMDSSGNVGIGTTNPTVELDVNGSIQVADTLRVSSTFLANSTAVDMSFNSLSITYVNTSNLITSNLIASTGNFNVYGNVVSVGYIQAPLYYGDAGLLSNVSSRAIVQPFANLVVSNSVTTTNVFATRLNLTTALAVTSGGTGTTTSTGTGSVVLSAAPTLTGTTNVATLIASGNITSLSDRRIKKDIKRIEGALDKVIQIGGYTFTRTDESSKNQRQSGVIAQEMLKVLPEVVQISEETGYYSVSYGNITALLIEALKEERVERLKLEERLACLENQSKATQ